MANKTNSQQPQTSLFVVVVKEQYQDKVFGFNGSIKPLNERTDHFELLEQAMISQSPMLLGVFETIPTQEQFDDLKADIYLQNNP